MKDTYNAMMYPWMVATSLWFDFLHTYVTGPYVDQKRKEFADERREICKRLGKTKD